MNMLNCNLSLNNIKNNYKSNMAVYGNNVIAKSFYNVSFGSDSFTQTTTSSDNVFFESVLGYQKAKEELYNTYLNRIFNQNSTINHRVPASIVLAFSDKVVLAEFKQGIYDSAKKIGLQCNDFSQIMATDSWKKALRMQLEKNKEHYKKTGKRSIIFIDNSENILGMNIQDANDRRNFSYDNAELQILKTNKNTDRVNTFKSLLDVCQGLPNSKQSGYATTFIFTSTKPYLINPDFRTGKMEKFYIPPMEKEEYTVWLNMQFENAKQEVLDLILNSEELNDDERAVKCQKLNTAELPVNSPLTSLASAFLMPNTFMGAYSVDTIKSVLKKACAKKSELPYSIPFSMVFADIISKTPRDISANEIKKYDSMITVLDKYESLKLLENDGMLKPDNYAELEQIIEQEKQQARTLLFKQKSGLLTPDEKLLLEKYRERYDDDFESKFTPSVKKLPYYGQELEYAKGKKACLYYGNCGYDPDILWVYPANKETLDGVLANIDFIKNQNQFNSIQKIQISEFSGIDKILNMKKTDYLDYDGNAIYDMVLDK